MRLTSVPKEGQAEVVSPAPQSTIMISRVHCPSHRSRFQAAIVLVHTQTPARLCEHHDGVVEVADLRAYPVGLRSRPQTPQL